MPSRFPFRSLVWASMIATCSGVVYSGELTPEEQLGKEIFFDAKLSTPQGKSCASCHQPETGFTGPSAKINEGGAVVEGAVSGRFGKRKPPTVSYFSFSPPFKRDEQAGTVEGGSFWDGRAHTLLEQSEGPLLNPVEQNNVSVADLLEKLRVAPYQARFEQVHGAGSLAPTPGNEARILQLISKSLLAYESSHEVNPFSSRYDAYLHGETELSEAEMRGLKLFEGKAQCSNCHPSRPAADGTPPLFTDFTFDNLGIPRNPENPFYKMPPSINPEGEKFVDRGLGEILKAEDLYGAFKVPTLRNVDRRPSPDFVKAYTHNGFFKSLKEVVHFYNVRDVETDKFPPAEVPETVNHDELGNLKLTDEEENDIVAFLGSLSDGYRDSQEITKIPTESEGTPAEIRPTKFENANSLRRIELFRLHRRQMAREEQGKTRR